jgi:hypothetical protein
MRKDDTHDREQDAPEGVRPIERHTRLEDLPEFLTVAEFACVMKCGRAAAYEYARTHGTRMGRLIRIRKTDLPSSNGQPGCR